MTITHFIQSKLDSFHGLPVQCRETTKHYLDGLIRAHEKSIVKIIREFQLQSTTQNFLKTLKKLKDHATQLNHHLFRQLQPHLDRRSRIILAGDDTTHRVYGKKIHAASIQHDHALNASVNSIKLVDVLASDLKDRMLLNDFMLYLPRKFLDKYPLLGYQFRSKIELLGDLLLEMIREFNMAGVPKKNIWVLVDSWYSSGGFEKRIRGMGANSVLQLKKNRLVRLFHEWLRIDQYFATYKPAHYFTLRPEKKKIFYKEATLDVSKFGRRKVFAFKEEGEKEWRYFLSGKLKLTARTAYKYIKRRWSVETMHRETKQFFGLEATYSGREDYLISHYLCSYLGWLLFQWFKWQVGKERDCKSTEELWTEYIREIREQENNTSRLVRGKVHLKRRASQKNVRLKNEKIPMEMK